MINEAFHFHFLVFVSSEHPVKKFIERLLFLSESKFLTQIEALVSFKLIKVWIACVLTIRSMIDGIPLDVMT